MNNNYKNILKIGAIAGILTVLTGILEIMITFLPEGQSGTKTVVEWFTLIHENWFMGLRNLGLMNIILVTFGIPLYYSLYFAHEKEIKPFVGFGIVISFIGAAVFFATNRTFPMLGLSNQYFIASTEAEKDMLIAAGKSMLAVGQSHVLGTFLAFALSEIAGIIVSSAMLKSKVFGKFTAVCGILGFLLLLVYESVKSFFPELSGNFLIVSTIGGILNLIWMILICIKLFNKSLRKSPTSIGGGMDNY